MILNVCSKLEKITGCNVILWRAIFVICSFYTFGFAIIVYLVLYFNLKIN